MLYPDGTKYDGEYLENDAHGYGKTTFVDGAIY
jgi:hypothetical protein